MRLYNIYYRKSERGDVFMKRKNKLSNILRLFLTMLKIGTFTFGGGYAMISLLEHEFVSKKGWIDKDEFIDLIAIAESTPGPIAINCSTYIGYKVGGVSGSVLATLGMCIPSLFIIYVISLFFDQFLSIEYVGYAFRGIQICVIYLILTAGIKMFKQIEKNAFNIILISSVFITTILVSIFSVNFSSVITILICGLLGVLIYLVKLIKGKEGGK